MKQLRRIGKPWKMAAQRNCTTWNELNRMSGERFLCQ